MSFYFFTHGSRIKCHQWATSTPQTSKRLLLVTMPTFKYVHISTLDTRWKKVWNSKVLVILLSEPWKLTWNHHLTHLLFCLWPPNLRGATPKLRLFLCHLSYDHWLTAKDLIMEISPFIDAIFPFYKDKMAQSFLHSLTLISTSLFPISKAASKYLLF